MQPRYDYALCFCLTWLVCSGCSVPDLQIVEGRENGTSGVTPPFVPRDPPSSATKDAGQDAEAPTTVAGSSARPTGTAAAGRNSSSTGGARAAAGSASNTGAAGAAGRSTGAAGAAVSGSGGSAGSEPRDAGTNMPVDAGPPPTTEPNPCLIWVNATSLSRAPDNAVEGGLEITAGLESHHYVCRVQPPDLTYPVPGKAIFGNGCLVAYRVNGTMKAHNQQNGTPFEVLTTGPGCKLTWQSAGNSSLPGGAVDLSEPPGRKLYACHGDFQGPLSSGLQLGGLQGASDTPPRYECWFESYTSPMQPLNPMLFEVLTQAP